MPPAQAWLPQHGSGAWIDMSSCTRDEYTNFILNEAIPDNADPRYKNLSQATNYLFKLLANHPAMAPNIHQKFSEKANVKTKVYFMWDSVARNRSHLLNTNPVTPNADKASKAAFSEAVERTIFLDAIIHDDSLAESMFKGMDQAADWGEEVKAASKAMVQASKA